MWSCFFTVTLLLIFVKEAEAQGKKQMFESILFSLKLKEMFYYVKVTFVTWQVTDYKLLIS